MGGWGPSGAPIRPLTLFKVTNILPVMQIGCGATVKEIRGRRYLYFWHYEDRNGRRIQAFRCLGPAHRSSTQDRLAEAISDYYERMALELRRRKEEALARARPA